MAGKRKVKKNNKTKEPKHLMDQNVKSSSTRESDGFLISTGDRCVNFPRPMISKHSAFFANLIKDGKYVYDAPDMNYDTVLLIQQCMRAHNGSVNEDCLEDVFDHAVRLGMDKIGRNYASKLASINYMNSKNCLEILALFKKHSNTGQFKFKYDKEIEVVANYITNNWYHTIRERKPDELSFAELRVVMDYAPISESNLFIFVNNWLSAKCGDRRQYSKKLLSQIRYGLLDLDTLDNIAEIDTTDDDEEDSWEGLVSKAEKYHKLPIHLKVLETSGQFQLRTKPTPVFFTSHSTGKPKTLFKLDEKTKQWTKTDKMRNMPDMDSIKQDFCVVVNNFLVTCTSQNVGQQHWWVFDPRTLTWSRIADLNKTRRRFVLVHHDKHLYVVGGDQVLMDQDRKRYEDCHTIDRYSFETNTWADFCEMPFCIQSPGVCVLEDTLIVSGKVQETDDHSLGYVNLKDPNKTWAQQHGFDFRMIGHKIFKMRINDEEVAIMMDMMMDVCYFSLSTLRMNETVFNNNMPFTIHDYDYDELWFTDGRETMYVVNSRGLDQQHNSSIKSWKWCVTKPDRPVNLPNHEFPRDNFFGVGPFGGMLALPLNI